MFSNYGPNHKDTKAQRTRKKILGSLRLDDPCGPWAGLARLSLVAAACPDCAARQGGPACLTGAGVAEGRSGQDHGFTRRRCRCEVPITEDNLDDSTACKRFGRGDGWSLRHLGQEDGG